MLSRVHGRADKCYRRARFPQTLGELEFERGIWLAAREGDQARVKTLLARGGSSVARAVAKDGYTALHYAARSGFSAVCSMLLAAGADVHAATCSMGWTALHRASSEGQVAVMRVLLDAGADVNAMDRRGLTPLDKALGREHADAVQLLRDSGGVCGASALAPASE